MNYAIRDKTRGYGVFDERFATRAKAEASLWRYAHLGGELVVFEAHDDKASNDAINAIISNPAGKVGEGE